MSIKLGQIEESLASIERIVGTNWLEKWVHEMKEIELTAAPMKKYPDLMEKIPPLAVVWCKARDELTMSSIIGEIKWGEVISQAYEIGMNMVECKSMPGFNEHIKLLKNKDRGVFYENCYKLAMAVGYAGLGYKPLLGRRLNVNYKGTPIEIMCRDGLMLTSGDLDLHKFWYTLVGELGRRLTFAGSGWNVLLTALEKPHLTDVMDIIKIVSPKLSGSVNQEQPDIELKGKYKVKLTKSFTNQRGKLGVPPGYEFGTIMGTSIIALNLAQGSERGNTIANICKQANDGADKKIPTILYVDIPVGQGEDVNVLLNYYAGQLVIEDVSHLENLVRIIITVRLLQQDNHGQNYVSRSVNNISAPVGLPGGFITYIPGQS